MNYYCVECVFGKKIYFSIRNKTRSKCVVLCGGVSLRKITMKSQNVWGRACQTGLWLFRGARYKCILLRKVTPFPCSKALGTLSFVIFPRFKSNVIIFLNVHLNTSFIECVYLYDKAIKVIKKKRYVLNLFLLRYWVNPVLCAHIKDYKESLIKTVELITLNEVSKLR